MLTLHELMAQQPNSPGGAHGTRNMGMRQQLVLNVASNLLQVRPMCMLAF